MHNLSWRIFFQEQVKLLTSGIWFQFYNAQQIYIFLLTRHDVTDAIQQDNEEMKEQ